ncbi:MAG: hypothetical protein EXS05_16630 [Planctomycetaceae bacterium]|nr:hypothetical protein [Planctomycetaceae bacterium]
MLAARHQDLDQLRGVYADTESVVLTSDGWQPEKGHETLSVVRELAQKRVWFAEPLISSTEAEVRRLFVRARELAEQIGKRVVCWMSDKAVKTTLRKRPRSLAGRDRGAGCT